jgi:hypothetical protein
MRKQSLRTGSLRVKDPMPSVRNLACLAVLMFGAVSSGLSQQPAQASKAAAAEPPAAAPLPTPAQAKVDAAPDNARPAASPQTPQQKQLADDTAKLLTLANELKKEMDKSSKDTLSLSVIKKAQEVEKLAHKVQDEMKASLVN